MAELKYNPVKHYHKVFLDKASKRRGFRKAYNALNDAYGLSGYAALTRPTKLEIEYALAHAIKKTAMKKLKAAVSHRERLIEELRANPKAARAYLAAAIEDADLRVLLAALRIMAETRGVPRVAEKAVTPYEHLYRTLLHNADEQSRQTQALLHMLARSSESIHEGRSKPVKKAFADIRKHVKKNAG